MSAPSINIDLRTVGFAPDSSGWRVAVETTTDGNVDRDLWPVVGWMTQEERVSSPDHVRMPREESGYTRVVAAIVNYAGGGADLMPVDDLWNQARAAGRSVDFWLVAPGHPLPKDFAAFDEAPF